ncbi:serine/threonine-protein kinase [Streptomyces sp. KMM 9044]|uniref:serine/threonine-protein kinase n=1 Tax=Streptomyces sp. KMM 9044 TaxID=2744474 RepID=UPI0021512C7F|nr:serine/threonine protein kinase [Streptomyces sp. KMM 9044]WAX79129.1 protein kinase [Streptomyces sp. KMM 9044]
MGEVFAGRYELVDPIGRGGVGAVWRAWDHRRRRYAAAKVLLQSDAHSLLRFVREQALRIDHPHVLAPTSWAADDDKVLFTMDLVTGGSLVHLVGDYGPLPPVFVSTLLDQLLAGLAAVHTEGVVHRDIKPANILLEATGTGTPRLRLSDFGIAMRLGEPRLTETDLVVGTPGYLAPEQIMGSEPDFPADLFAVGLVALYLLEGVKPDAKALIQYFAEHGTPGAPQGIPEPLWQVVATLLQPDPQARFRTATGARKALAAARELLTKPGPDDEMIEVFDQLGPLPAGFGPDGPLKAAAGVRSGGGRGRPGAEGLRPQDEETGLRGDAGPVGHGPVGPGPADLRSADAGPAGPVLRPFGGGDSTPASPDSSSMDGGTAPTDPRQSISPEPRSVPRAPRTPASDSSAVPPPAPSVPPQPPSMSDTGSFPLPPPQATVTPSPAPAPPHHAHTPPPPPVQAPLPARSRAPGQHQSPYHAQPQVARAGQLGRMSRASPHDPTRPLLSPHPQPSARHRPASHRDDPSTAEYTTGVTEAPSPGRAGPRHGASSRRRRRPGPPAQVAVALLFLALACYAVGFWALTRI